MDRYVSANARCYETDVTPASERQACLRQAQANFEQDYYPWALSPYLREHSLGVLAAITIPPVIVYWLILGIYGLMLWLYRGFKPDVA